MRCKYWEEVIFNTCRMEKITIEYRCCVWKQFLQDVFRTAWRCTQEVEGTALEMRQVGFRRVGSTPTISAMRPDSLTLSGLCFFRELVACCRQSTMNTNEYNNCFS